MKSAVNQKLAASLTTLSSHRAQNKPVHMQGASNQKLPAVVNWTKGDQKFSKKETALTTRGACSTNVIPTNTMIEELTAEMPHKEKNRQTLPSPFTSLTTTLHQLGTAIASRYRRCKVATFVGRVVPEANTASVHSQRLNPSYSLLLLLPGNG
jgi:hypothetical protein